MTAQGVVVSVMSCDVVSMSFFYFQSLQDPMDKLSSQGSKKKREKKVKTKTDLEDTADGQ